MMKSRITKGAGHRLALEAFRQEAEQRLSPPHLELWRARGCARYEMFPQADEWKPVVGFAPDREFFYEYGFLLADEQSGGTVVVCRALVDRHEASPTVRLDWYPVRIDLRKRPD
ncbi:MAG: hypothetical protein J0I06_05315 [Planctomycetes bacterium]|nr:hypothetical protein [Planctomycetota bacterium]